MFYSKKLNQFREIKHCFFSRKGGFSRGIYKSLNCGKGSGDNKKNITKNLRFVAKKMKLKKILFDKKCQQKVQRKRGLQEKEQ